VFRGSQVAKQCPVFLVGKGKKPHHRILTFQPNILFKEKPVLKEIKSFLTKIHGQTTHKKQTFSGKPKTTLNMKKTQRKYVKPCNQDGLQMLH